MYVDMSWGIYNVRMNVLLHRYIYDGAIVSMKYQSSALPRSQAMQLPDEIKIRLALPVCGF